MAKMTIRTLLVLASVASLPTALLADEIVHFTNGAEMPVRAHTVEQSMVKLDLGNSNFISFPMSMVDKIVASGQEVFVNPTFHPANQAIAGAPVAANGGAPAGGGLGGEANTIRGTGAPVGYAPQPNPRGGAGVMLGEAADIQPQTNAVANPNALDTDLSRRRVFNPAMPTQPGQFPQVIMPPSGKRPGSMTLVAPPRVGTPSQPGTVPQPQPQAPAQGESQGDATPDTPDNNN